MQGRCRGDAGEIAPHLDPLVRVRAEADAQPAAGAQLSDGARRQVAVGERDAVGAGAAAHAQAEGGGEVERHLGHTRVTASSVAAMPSMVWHVSG